MAIRVKKLARELRGSPAQVIALLAELGYDRYTSPMDMVADVPADKVRKLGNKGLPDVDTSSPAEPRALAAAPVPAEPLPANAPKPTTPAGPAGPVADLMAQLVPGVTPVAPRQSLPLDLPLEALASAGGVVIPDLSDTTDALRAEDARLEARARALSTKQSGLEQATARLEAERDALRAERDGLERERAQLQAQLAQAHASLEARAAALDAVEAGGVPLGRLLEQRGLYGADEQGRALAALALGRLLDPIIQRLRVVDTEPVRALLNERVALASGPVEGIDGVAVVQVPPERAELPGGDALRRVRTRLADEFLLSGMLRARIVGSDSRALRLLRTGLDPRIDLFLVPAASRDVGAARSDVDGVDVVVLWNVRETEPARAVYDSAAAVVVRVTGPRLTDLVAGLHDGLADA